MKIYYTINILAQLVLAVLSCNRNKISYMLYLLQSVFDHDIFNVQGGLNSDLISPPENTKSQTISDKYSFLLER